MKLIRLDTWLKLTYGEDAPSLDTARDWARLGKLQPPAQKHGRAYFVHPEARYTDGPPDILDRLRADEAKAYAH